MELKEPKSDPRFSQLGDRLKHKEELNAILDDAFACKTSIEWRVILDEAGVPCGPVNTIDKVFDDPAILHRRMVISMDHSGAKARFFGNPIKMSATPITGYGTPPYLGANNKEILCEYVGFSAEYVEQLKKEGILWERRQNL